MFSGLPNSHLYSAYRIVSTFVLRDQTEKSKAGTAFFVRNNAGKICLISNRHIMDVGYGEPSGKYVGAKLHSLQIEGHVAAGGDVNATPMARLSLVIHPDASAVLFPSNYDEDVACILNPRGSVQGAPRIDFFIDGKELANDTWIKDKLSVCDFVAFPGFPPWCDKHSERPILRTGAISSDPRTDYSDEPRYKGRRVAYEAFSFDGSSGSPIFATQKGFRPGHGIEVSGFREARLVGINAGHLRADLGAHSGISYFIKSSAILDLIDGANSL